MAGGATKQSAGASHTPGPWTIEDYGDDDAPTLVIHKDSESRVCFMATPGSHGDAATIEADARLIVAAPDLKAALEPLAIAARKQAELFRHQAKDSTSGIKRVLIEAALRWEKLHDDAAAALAKATGAAS